MTDGITVRPERISITTSKPMRISNKTIEGEVPSNDKRIRRLIPYYRTYYPQQEFNNYPLEYLPYVSKFVFFYGDKHLSRAFIKF